jgi:hypothetical protein
MEAWTNTQISNGILNTTIPIMPKTFELQRESNRLLLHDILSELYAMLRVRCGAATIRSTRTIGEVHNVDRYWGDRVLTLRLALFRPALPGLEDPNNGYRRRR